jgi:hypothetical protein
VKSRIITERTIERAYGRFKLPMMPVGFSLIKKAYPTAEVEKKSLITQELRATIEIFEPHLLNLLLTSFFLGEVLSQRAMRIRPPMKKLNRISVSY